MSDSDSPFDMPEMETVEPAVSIFGRVQHSDPGDEQPDMPGDVNNQLAWAVERIQVLEAQLEAACEELHRARAERDNYRDAIARIAERQA